jgi:hypothetical protein
MATLEAIGDAIAAAVATLNIRPEQDTDQTPNVTGSTLAALVEYDGSTWDATFRGGSSDLGYKVTVVGSRSSDRATRQKLFALVDPTPAATGTMRSAVNGTLGGLVADCVLKTNSGIREYTIGSGDGSPNYIGIEFVLEVMPS